MTDKLKQYLDQTFSEYEELKEHGELKEELYLNLQDKMKDYIAKGVEKETALQMTIDSIGDISELVESINGDAQHLVKQKWVGRNFSKSSLGGLNFQSADIKDGKFNYSTLKGAHFSEANLANSHFICSDLKQAHFDGANLSRTKILFAALKDASLRGADLSHAKILFSDLKGVDFKGCTLDQTDFRYSSLSGIQFDGLKMNGTNFKNAALKGASFRDATLINVSFKKHCNEAIFDGASMDQSTYAVLEKYGANLDNVTIMTTI